MTDASIAVLDIGKTNVRLWAATPDGALVESRATVNPIRPGPPWPHHDLGALGPWIAETLADLCSRHSIRRLIPVGHGSGGVLTTADPNDKGTGAALPMIDYEAECPPDIDAAYSARAGTFEDRGSPVMMASTHCARQLLWMQTADAAAVAAARHYLNIAQYWAWWLTGIAASEYSAMGAQSHFWNTPQGRWTPIVKDNDWSRLMPPFGDAWQPLGPIRPDLARRFGLPDDIEVLTGAHDSSANFYRYRAAGLTDFTLVSTGTWIVAMSREADIAALDETRGTAINADMQGRPVGGALTMGGRAFSRIAGPDWDGAPANPASLARLVAQGTMALPSFGEAGQFPGTEDRGRITGPPPASQDERAALALLHAALLTATCADVLNGGSRLILDGTFLQEPLYAPLVAALRPGHPTHLSRETNGVAAGAAILAGHATRTQPARLEISQVTPARLPGLETYGQRWREAAEQIGKGPTA